MSYSGLPVNYSQMPQELKAIYQLQRHLYNIKKEAGFNRDVEHVFINRKDFENIQNYPAVNIYFGVVEVLNANDIDRSIQVMNKKATIYLDWILKSDDPILERSLIQADVEKYFLSDYNYWLPESNDGSGNNPTIFNLMFSQYHPYGDDQNKPTCKLEMEMFMWYRTVMGNPYERI